MNYSHPQIRKIAERLPILCAIYFALFTLPYLYVFQRDVLAQAQFMLSGGVTVYHPLLSALLSTVLLLVVGFFVTRSCPWLPLRLKALAWFPSYLLLGALSHWHFPLLGNTTSSAGWPTYTLLIVAYGLTLFLARLHLDSFKERQTFSTYAWPNALLLILFSLLSTALSNTDDMEHHTLLAVRHIDQHDYDQALQAAQWERYPSRQLSAMTALALSKTGQLGNRLFAYPQLYGSEGLLPMQCDTLLFTNLPLHVGHHLGYRRGDHLSASAFLTTICTMPKATAAARDYLLCARLLDDQLNTFANTLLSTDTLSAQLPIHYQEAYVLCQHLHPQQHGQDSIPDATLYARLEEFLTLLSSYPDADEREFHARERFGQTYWFYYFFTGKSKKNFAL